MTDLSAIIERVESGVGPDRELDLAICLAIGTHHIGRNDEPYYIDAEGRHVYGGQGWEVITPHLTSSMDAVIWRIEAVLPGKRKVLMECRETGPAVVEIGWLPEGRQNPRRIWTTGTAESLPRAATSAALRAIQESRNADR